MHYISDVVAAVGLVHFSKGSTANPLEVITTKRNIGTFVFCVIWCRKLLCPSSIVFILFVNFLVSFVGLQLTSFLTGHTGNGYVERTQEEQSEYGRHRGRQQVFSRSR